MTLQYWIDLFQSVAPWALITGIIVLLIHNHNLRLDLQMYTLIVDNFVTKVKNLDSEYERINKNQEIMKMMIDGLEGRKADKAN